MPITWVKGDLWAGQYDARVIPVNCVGVPGAGLAKQWAQRYPEDAAVYKRNCKARLIRPGSCYSYGLQSIGIATKDHWRSASSLGWIKNGLVRLGKYLSQRDDDYSIAVPALGCGLGDLDWRDVRPLIEQHLGGLACKVFVFEPQEG